MHGSTRLPSRSGRPRVTVGKPVVTVSAASASPLFSTPSRPSAPTTVRLPSLAFSTRRPNPAAQPSRQREALPSEVVEAARSRYTSSLKKTPHGSTGHETTPIALFSSNEAPPPALAQLEKQAELPVADDGKAPSGSFTSAPAFTTSNAPAAPPSLGSVDTLLGEQQYVELYLVLSTLLPTSTQRPVRDDARSMHILGYRAIASAGLLRFKESAEDGLASLSIRRRLREVGCVFASHEEKAFAASVDECVMRALIMSERYRDAAEVSDTLGSATHVVNARHAEAAVTAQQWREAAPDIACFRGAVAEQDWSAALAALKGREAANACLRSSPLCAMLGFVHVEAGHPMTARALLLAYLANLPEPPAWESLTTLPPEHEQLWDSFRSHYVFCTTVLARASVMSGSAYLNIAAALLQRCLRVLPLYTPARLLAEFVLTYEGQQHQLEAAMAAQDFASGLAVSLRMLTLPGLCRALQAEVYLARTQLQWLRRLPLEVVREAALCLEADPECAMALRLRADALEVMGQSAEAVADRAAASLLNPRVDVALAELLSQRNKYDAAQRAATAQQRAFSGFTTGARPSSLAGAQDDDSSEADGRRASGKRAAGGAGASTSQPIGASPLPAAEPTHYAVLGVTHKATAVEIRQRYRQLTLQCHPDRLVDATPERRSQAAEEFKRIGNAYSVLSDVQQRSAYDAAHRFSV